AAARELLAVDRPPALDRHDVDAALGEQRVDRLAVVAGRDESAAREVLDQTGHGLLGVALVRPEDPGRPALDPADGVDARKRRAVRRVHPAALVGQDEAALLERDAGERDGAVADGTQDEAARNRLDVVAGRAGAQRAVVGAGDLVAADVDGLDPAVAADLDRRAQEAQLDAALRAGALGPGGELA